METFKAELKRFETDKATIRFTVDKPLSISLFKKLVKARMAEMDAAAVKKKKLK